MTVLQDLRFALRQMRRSSRLADESAESGWLSPELLTGIRRVKGVKCFGRMAIASFIIHDPDDPPLHTPAPDLKSRTPLAHSNLATGQRDFKKPRPTLPESEIF